MTSSEGRLHFVSSAVAAMFTNVDFVNGNASVPVDHETLSYVIDYCNHYTTVEPLLERLTKEEMRIVGTRSIRDVVQDWYAAFITSVDRVLLNAILGAANDMGIAPLSSLVLTYVWICFAMRDEFENPEQNDGRFGVNPNPR
mmetsp:Transcript_21631/g.45671  ORF Transcript_21631/g.45671 Transcript_21631/m.45671 type:complete len:142 (+) Transcript_21631:334-759(+)